MVVMEEVQLLQCNFMILRRSKFMTMPEIREEFERNGRTIEMDDFDDFVLVSRRKGAIGPTCKRQAPTEEEVKMQQAIDKARRALGSMRSLSDRKHCVFCKTNKEHVRVYSTHVVKDEQGRVTCPILRKYKCPTCNATGSNAHTIKYCPFNDGIGAVDSLFRTPRNGAGKQRKISVTDGDQANCGSCN